MRHQSQQLNNLLNKFILLPQKAQIILLASIFLLVLCFGYIINISLVKNKITNLKQKNLTIITTMQSKKFYQTSLPKLHSTVENLEQEYLAYQQQFNDKFTPATLLKIISNNAKNHHVLLASIKPQEKVLTGFAMEINAHGTYRQLVAFISAIAKIKHPIVISNLNLETNSSNLTNEKELSLTALLLAYNSNDITNFKPRLLAPSSKQNVKLPATHAPNIPKISRDPFSFSLPTNTQSLAIWLPTDLKYLGNIQQDDKNLGIIMDPAGLVHHVTYGDKIGQQQSKILKITADEIITEHPDDNLHRSNNDNEI
jgi:Tfp pilus assembly protein PilO